MKKHIPNIITCCNLLCGVVATYMATQQQYTFALLLIILAAVFDFFDGFAARLLHVASPIGKELDSLADDITFGLAPSMMLFCYLSEASRIGILIWLVLLMAAFSALRLAKFNTDERQTSSFIGLATPANALFWASLVAFAHIYFAAVMPDGWAYAFVVMSLLSCYLLVAEVPFFSLKMHNLSWSDNKPQFIFLAGVLLLLLFLGAMALWVIHSPAVFLSAGMLIIVWYVLLAFLFAVINKH